MHFIVICRQETSNATEILEADPVPFGFNDLDTSLSDEEAVRESPELDLDGTESSYDGVACHCGQVHSEELMKEALSKDPAPPRDIQGFNNSGFHTCQDAWLETTHRISNKLFVCLACWRMKFEKLKFWCFKSKPLLYSIKRHYLAKHRMDPVTHQMFPKCDRLSIMSSERLNKQVLMWIVNRNHPFSLVDEEEFRNLISSLSPELKLLHRTQLVSKYLPIVAQEMEQKVCILPLQKQFYFLM